MVTLIYESIIQDHMMEEVKEIAMKYPIIERVKKVSKHKLHGCSLDEIDEVMGVQQVSYLPEVYVELLLLAGHSLDWFFLGNDCTCNHLHYLKREFLEDLASEGLYLPNDVFVFRSSQGYIWNFFRTKNSPLDPEIYCHKQGENSFDKIAISFTDYIEKELDRTYISEENLEKFLYDSTLDEFLPIKE